MREATAKAWVQAQFAALRGARGLASSACRCFTDAEPAMHRSSDLPPTTRRSWPRRLPQLLFSLVLFALGLPLASGKRPSANSP